MSRSWILVPAIAVLLGCASSLPDPVYGQVPVSFLATSVRPDAPGNRCDNAPPACEGSGWTSTPGRQEFDLYRYPGAEYPTDAARFCLTWPDGWTFISAEICYGTLVSGDPSVRGALLDFEFPDCPYESAPFLRIVLDCPSSGSFRLGCDPSVRLCGGGDEWMEELIPSRCDVGDWCGRFPNQPCSWCSLQHRNSAGFDPPNLEITLLPGQTWSGLLHARGDLGPECGGAPECGEGYGMCLAGLESDVPWMERTVFWPPDDGYHNIPYLLRVDSGGLPPGRYAGNIVSSSGCGWCVPNCMPVTLIVQDPAAVDAPPGAQGVRLDGPYPNPAAARFEYTISAGAPTHARVAILDVAGRRVAELLDRDLPAGTHTFAWSRNDDGLPSGSYILRLETDAVRQSRLIVLAH